jgi:hypothetical protein
MPIRPITRNRAYIAVLQYHVVEVSVHVTCLQYNVVCSTYNTLVAVRYVHTPFTTIACANKSNNAAKHSADIGSYHVTNSMNNTSKKHGAISLAALKLCTYCCVNKTSYDKTSNRYKRVCAHLEAINSINKVYLCIITKTKAFYEHSYRVHS